MPASSIPPAAPEQELLPPDGVKYHDAIVRTLSERPELATELVLLPLPAEMEEELAGELLRPQQGDHVDTDLRQAVLDRLLLVRLPGGRDMLVVVEGKSAPDAKIVEQLARYGRLALEWYRRTHPGRPEPVLLLMAVYSGVAKWRPRSGVSDPERIAALVREELGGGAKWFWFAFLDLVSGGWDLGALRQPAARALLRALAWRKSDGEAGLREILRDAPAEGDLAERLIRYLMYKSGLTRERLVQVCYDVNPQLKETAMTIVEEVKVDVLQRTLQMQLAQRFGAVSEQARAQIEAATLEQLDGWLREVLAADSVEAVLANGSAGAAR